MNARLPSLKGSHILARGNATMGQVDRGQALDEQPLLAQGIAIVRGHRGVNALTGHRARPGQQRAAPDGHGRAVNLDRRLSLSDLAHRALDDSVGAEHAAHHPWIARCFTSATKP